MKPRISLIREVNYQAHDVAIRVVIERRDLPPQLFTTVAGAKRRYQSVAEPGRSRRRNISTLVVVNGTLRCVVC